MTPFSYEAQDKLVTVPPCTSIPCVVRLPTMKYSVNDPMISVCNMYPYSILVETAGLHDAGTLIPE